MAAQLNQQIAVHTDPDPEIDEHGQEAQALIDPNDQIQLALGIDGKVDSNEEDTLLEEVTIDPSTTCYCWKAFIHRLDQMDKKLSSYVFKWSPGKFMDVLIAIPCLAFSYFGFPLWIVLYVIMAESFLYALAVLVSIVVTQIMKRCFKRSRPKLSDLGQRWFYLSFEDISAEHSFPSGDTSQSAVFAVTLAYSVDRYYWFALLFTPFVALGRVYFGRHYIGDTIAGALTGCAVGYATNYFLVHHMYNISNYYIET